MASYQDIILSFNPVLFFRLNEVGGTVLVDSSSYGTDGTLYTPTFGVASPILTDPASFAMSGSVGKVLIADAPQSDIRSTFTWIAWGYISSDSSQQSHLITRNGQIGLGGGNWLALDPGGGDVRFTLNISGTDYELNYTPPVRDTFGMAMGVRNSATMLLYWNADLVAQRSDLPTADINVGSSNAWFFGSAQNQNLWPSQGLDEPTIVPTALTAEQGVTIYEAAVGATFLNGRSDANPTAILLSSFEPDPISFPFRHNWTEALIERISFRTGLSQAVSGVEESVSERPTPRRELEFVQVLKNQSERRKLRALLWANQNRKWFIPIRQYAERLLESLDVSTTLTPITTAYKDYEIGSWIGFREVDGSGVISHWEERLITSLNPNSVEHEPLVHSYAAYLSSVYPVRRALLQPQLSIKGHSDVVEELNLTARLLPEDEQLIPNRITTFTPTIKYRDVEVFDGRAWQSNDWSEQREYELERAGSDVDFDTGLMSFESDTIAASETFSYRMTIQGIDLISAFLGWYYERVGALQLLWVATMQEDFEILFINIPEHQITVRDTNYSDAYALAEPRRDLAFVYWDGTMKFRRVIAFELAGENETLRLDAAVPTTANLRFVSLLKYCRLDADQLELAWQTDNVVQVAWRFRELLNTPEGTGVSSLSPSASISHSLSPSSSASPSSSISLSPSPSQSQSPSPSLSPSHSSSPST
jgi:hypothetical protein